MSCIHARGGWLLYSGQLGVIAADVLDADMSMRSRSLDVTSIVSPVRQLVYGPPDITFTAQLGRKIDWNQAAAAGEPPDLNALLALARRHPDEYQRWHEAETVLKALGG